MKLFLFYNIVVRLMIIMTYNNFKDYQWNMKFSNDIRMNR